MKPDILALSQVWPWRKNGHGQLKVIIWTTLVLLE